ncbi:hypothetical protein WMY93_005394 [Mugilogobius chulae]|uniref:Ig-like domain-containing protein n=1 Tax=Mugilogobius chulae TaxID=88201 RepID=A0AAW0PQU4_9GOBI
MQKKRRFSLCLFRDSVTLDVPSHTVYLEDTVNLLLPQSRSDSVKHRLTSRSSVTLSCDVYNWNGKLKWIRQTSQYSVQLNLGKHEKTVSVSQRGDYYCRGEDDHVTTKLSNAVTVVDSVPTVRVSEPEVFVGERVSLRCEVEGGADTDWTYHWSRNKPNQPPTSREYTVWSVKASVTLQTPVQPVYQGDSVTLLCSGPAQRHLHFYKDGSKMNQQQLQYKSTTTSLKSVQLTISGVSKSDEGQYSCGINERVQSDTWTLHCYRKTSPCHCDSQSSIVPAGGSVILSCNIEGFTEGYRWFRVISVSRGGEYSCRGQDQFILTPQSLTVTVKETGICGERVSLRCEVERGADTDWTYHWRKNRLNLRPTSREYTVWSVSESDRGEYSCRAQRGPHITTVWSTSSSVSVLLSIQTSVTVTGASQLHKGDSVQLFCSVSPSSSGWKYDWSRNEQLFKEGRRVPVQSPQRKPPYFTELSHKLRLTVTDAPVSLSVSPDTAQHFTDDVITLSCGFNSTGADRPVYRRFSNNSLSTQQCNWRWRKDSSKCEFSFREKSSAVFWCESGSGEMSNSINISVHSDIILMSPVRAVTEGQSVSLTCKLKTGTLTSVRFYHNGKIIQNGPEAEFNISAVSRSDQGFYKCEGQMKSKPKTVTSAESWMSVQTKGDVSSFPVMWVVGPVCAVVLLILLLLLWSYIKTKGKKSSSENGEAGESQDNQQQLYSSLLHGDSVTLEVPSHTVYLEDIVDLYCSGHDGTYLFTKMGHLCNWTHDMSSSRRVEETVSNTDTPAGGSVTLSCDVHDWTGKLKWFRQTSQYSVQLNLGKYEKTISVSQRGDYYCRGEDDHVTTKLSNAVTVVDSVPTVSVSESVVFVGERVSLRCEVEGGADTDWTYHWSRNKPNQPPTSREYTVWSVSESDRGEYSCRAQRGPHITTVWSTSSSVSVQKASVTLQTPVQPVYQGDSVTLLCSGPAQRHLHFYKDGSKMDPQQLQYKFTTTSLKSVQLTISGVSKSDEGQYSCGINEKVQSDTWTLTLTEASVTLQTPVQPVYQGDSVTLLCSGPAQRHLHFFKDESKMNQLQLQYKSTTTSLKSVKLTISGVSKSDEGQYSCGINERVQSDTWTLTVTERHRRVTVTPQSSIVPAGGSVILSCNIEGFTEGYRWFRSIYSHSKTSQWISVSRGGEYSCRGQDQFILTPLSLTVTVIETGESCSLTLSSDCLLLTCKSFSFYKVSVSPNGPEVFVGERVSLRCEVEGGADTDWTYHWRKNTLNLLPTSREYTVWSVSESDRGEYSCRAQRGPHITTVWSTSSSVSVLLNKPQVTVTGASQLLKGDSVQLFCSVSPSSAGWKYDWSRNEQLFKESSSEAQVTVSEAGEYQCRARRGEPPYFTELSHKLSLTVTGHSLIVVFGLFNACSSNATLSCYAESPVFLSVSPDTAQHFTDDVITLSCGFNSTGADRPVYRRFSKNSLSTQQCNWPWRKDICKFSFLEKSSAVFWCESGSGQMSNSINISVHSDIILMSPVRAVTEGQSVSLTCKLKTGTLTSVRFYHNGKIIQNGPEAEFNISAVSRSDQGFYKCEGQMKSKPKTVTSAESWMSVQSEAKGDVSSFPVMWVVGPVCAVVLLILLLLLWSYIKTKGNICDSMTQPSNQSSAEDHVTGNDNSSPPQDVTYSMLELTHMRERRNAPQDESCVYSDVNPNSSVLVLGSQDFILSKISFNLRRHRLLSDQTDAVISGLYVVKFEVCGLDSDAAEV